MAINYDGEAYWVEQPAMDTEPVSRYAHGYLVEDDEENLAALVLTDKEDYTWQGAREHMARLESSTYTPISADGEEGAEDFLFFASWNKLNQRGIPMEMPKGVSFFLYFHTIWVNCRPDTRLQGYGNFMSNYVEACRRLSKFVGK